MKYFLHFLSSFLLIAISFSALSQNTEIAAHRGANHLAPENTYAAAHAAIELGVDYVEIDVRKSRDGIHFIIHDMRVNRTTNGSGFVSEMTASQLRKLDAGSWFKDSTFTGEKIPELYEYLKWINGKTKVYFDVKSANWDTLYAYVKEFNMQDECFFNFFSSKKAKKLKEQFPELHIKVNSYSSDPEDLRKKVKKYNASIIEIRPEHLNEDLLKAAEEEGVRIMVYARNNDEKEYRKILELAPPLVNLDRPSVFMKVKTQMQQKSTKK